MNKLPHDHTSARSQVEEAEQWEDWMNRVPPIQFPADWYVQIIPPFCGAMVRFRVTRPDVPGTSVSVYLDVHSVLGCCEHPYWEIYEYDGDVKRFPMEDVDALIVGIHEIFEGTDKHGYND